MGQATEQFSRRQKIALYLRRLRHWLYRLRGALIFTSVIAGWIALCWAIAQLSGVSELKPIVHQAGFFIELTSISVLLWRLGLLQAFFDKTPWWRRPWSWLKEFPTSYIVDTVHITPGTIGISTDTAVSAEVSSEPESLEERIERLEDEIERIEDKVDEVQTDLQEKINEVSDALEEYMDSQSKRLEQINTIIEEISIGGDGFTWELMALGWLLVASLLTNEPSWVVGVLNHLSLV